MDNLPPGEHRPAEPLFVPVRLGSAGRFQLRFLRTPLGVRTAIGFTGERRLRAAFGENQAWIRLAEPALRALAEPLGVTAVTVDPRLTTPAPVVAGRESRGTRRDADTVGVPRVTATTASLWTAATAVHTTDDPPVREVGR
ncbi:SAV_915 family protein [Streptomyces sp. NPDC019396]|uniref:SAV_915 family protein n=1 Tax=Streptomyces sp. NPDC019396 TaxID=3154687 RepID=UPI003408BE6D